MTQELRAAIDMSPLFVVDGLLMNGAGVNCPHMTGRHSVTLSHTDKADTTLGR